MTFDDTIKVYAMAADDDRDYADESDDRDDARHRFDDDDEEEEITLASDLNSDDDDDDEIDDEDDDLFDPAPFPAKAAPARASTTRSTAKVASLFNICWFSFRCGSKRGGDSEGMLR